MEKSKIYNLKEKRPQVLLVGNGLLRPSNNDYSWENIIKKMKKDEVDEIKFAGLPYAIQATVVTEVDDKKRYSKYAEAFKNYPYDNKEIILDYTNLPFDAILTTNYTYELENSIENKYSSLGNASKRKRIQYTADKAEKKFFLRTYNKISSNDFAQNIWHIHGELRNKESIVLTHNEYARLTAKILNYVKERKNEYQKFYEELSFKSWVDYLLMGDVYIVGQGLDYAEFDLWWLLSRRMRENAQIGRAIYYDPKFKDEEKNKNHLEKIEALKALNVESRDLNFVIIENEDYSKFYELVLKDIQTEVNIQ